MAKSAEELSSLIRDGVLKDANREWSRLRFLQKNIDGGLNKTWMPEHADLEYKDLFRKARSPWLRFVRDCIAQGLIIDGYSDADIWAQAWQANGFDGRQGAVNREVIGLGYGYVLTLPSSRPGEVVMRPLSALSTFAVKEDPWDEYPAFVLHKVADDKWHAFDEDAHYVINGKLGRFGEADVKTTVHGQGFTPVSLIPNSYAMSGFPESEIESAIPVYKRIVDATFTLQMVQRYGAFPQKYQVGGEIGMEEDGSAMVRPAVDSMLHSPDYETKFGDFAAANITQVADAVDAHIKHLSALTQVPPHYLLGAITNMSAEGIAAAEAGYFRNLDDHKVVMGEGYELSMRSAAAILGDEAAALDTSSQVHWADTSTRSLAQISDAVVKLQTVGAPVEMLFAMIPGWSKTDALEAAEYVKRNGAEAASQAIQANATQTARGFAEQIQASEQPE